MERLTGWLEHRRGAIRELEVAVQYPDAEALLPQLLPPLAPALRRLVLRGACSDWPYQWVDWRWLAGMSQVGGAGQGRAGSAGREGGRERQGAGFFAGAACLAAHALLALLPSTSVAPVAPVAAAAAAAAAVSPKPLQLQSLELWDALPGMSELQLPPSLTELHIDR